MEKFFHEIELFIKGIFQLAGAVIALVIFIAAAFLINGAITLWFANLIR